MQSECGRNTNQRRSADTWQAWLDEQVTSGLTVEVFSPYDVGEYSQFLPLARGLLQEKDGSGGTAVKTDISPAATAPRRPSEFIDLGALEDLAPPAPRGHVPRPTWSFAWSRVAV